MKKTKLYYIGRRFKSRSIAVALLLFMYIGVISSVYALYIDDLSKKNCYTELSASTKESCRTIENKFRNDRLSLRLLSRMIAQEDSLYSNQVNNFLTSYDVNSLISNIAILTPDNKIVQSRQHNTTAGEIMKYETESKKGEHISELRKSSIMENTDVMYSFMPIRVGGKTKGVLFTELNPSAVVNAWSPEIYDGNASFCIIDRDTGAVLINDWNDEIKNISNIGYDELTKAILNGEKGFKEIKYGKKEQFVSYMPMELENWEIAFFIDQDVVLASNIKLHYGMQFFLAACAGGFVLCLFLLIWSNRRSIANAEKDANTDVLTSLQNRNRYEKLCIELKGNEKKLTCIYIDANGLHEMNNSKGHLAGDQMLRFIADTLKVSFGEEMTFRIGGDEFVVFQEEFDLGKIQTKLTNFAEALEKNGYYASVGVCSAEDGISIESIIKTAEKRMYEDKKKYYERIGKAVRNIIE